MNSRPKQPKYARNKNVVVIGGSGSGKTRFFVKPNLMQLHSSYVLTDPTKIKSKVMFNLTKRQLICFSAAVAIGLPLFFLVKDSVGTTTAALCIYRRFQLGFVACSLLFGGVFRIAFPFVLSRHDDG